MRSTHTHTHDIVAMYIHNKPAKNITIIVKANDIVYNV